MESGWGKELGSEIKEGMWGYRVRHEDEKVGDVIFGTLAILRDSLVLPC